MQNDRQRCKIKVRKFLFNILWRFGVMEEKWARIGLRKHELSRKRLHIRILSLADVESSSQRPYKV